MTEKSDEEKVEKEMIITESLLCADLHADLVLQN